MSGSFPKCLLSPEERQRWCNIRTVFCEPRSSAAVGYICSCDFRTLGCEINPFIVLLDVSLLASDRCSVLMPQCSKF